MLAYLSQREPAYPGGHSSHINPCLRSKWHVGLKLCCWCRERRGTQRKQKKRFICSIVAALLQTALLLKWNGKSPSSLTCMGLRIWLQPVGFGMSLLFLPTLDIAQTSGSIQMTCCYGTLVYQWVATPFKTRNVQLFVWAFKGLAMHLISDYSPQLNLTEAEGQLFILKVILFIWIVKWKCCMEDWSGQLHSTASHICQSFV